MSYDGAKLRLVNMITSHVERAVTLNQMNAFNCCIHANTCISGYENIFFLAYNQSQVRAYDVKLERLAQLDLDIEVAVISMHWHREKLRLYLAGTNGWVKCYQLKYKFVVSDFIAEWTLLFEIRATMDWIISMAHDDFHGILYGAAETSLLAFDLDTGKLKFTLSDVHDGYKICQVYVDNESSVATTSGLDGTVRTWLLKMKKCVTLNKIDLECPGWVSFARTGRSIITISSDRKIRHFGVSDSILRCEIDMSGSCKPPSPDEVIKANIIVLPDVKCIEGSLCVTAHQGNIQAALLGYAPEESISFDSKVLQISYSERENNIMCLCEGNFLIVGSSEGPKSSIDLDVSCGPKCQRSGTSKTRCVCCYKDIVFAGLHNGGVKCINLENMSDCRMLEDMPLDDPIIHLEVVEGMFQSNHPICGGLNPIPILPDHPFIIGFTLKGCISVWCGKCYSQVLKQDFEKPNMTQFIVRKDKKMIFVSGASSLSVFRIEAYEFEFVASLPTPGNQIMTSFVITDDFVLVAGTNSGELLILQMEFDIETGMAFNPKYRLRATTGIAKLFYDQDSGKVGATLVNGTVLAINPETGDIIFNKKNTEADPLSAILFLSKGGRLGVFLAFGTRLHFAEIDTTDPEPEPHEEEEIVEEKPPEPVPEPEVEEEEEVSEATRQKEAQKRLHKLRKVLALAKLKKKRMRYIPECSSRFGPPPAPPLPPPPPKLTYEEVMERNAKLVRNEYEAPKKVIKRPKTSAGTRRYHVVEYEDEDDEVGLTVQPFFYTDLPEDSKVMIPPVRPSSHYASRSQLSGRAKTPEKVVLYERNGNFAEIGNLEELSESDLSEARASVSMDGRYMLSKTRSEKVRAPTVVHKAFVGPPSAPRVLFNDPTTRNGLSFFDPRGFQMPLFGSESEQGSQIGDAEGEMNGEEDANEESGEQILLKSMRQRSELEMRQMRKKKRVSMRDLMTPTTTPTTKPKPKPKIFAKPVGHAETTKIDLTNKPRLSDIWRKPQEEQRRMQVSQNSGQAQTTPSKTQTISASGETPPLMVITNANIKQDQLARTQPSPDNEETAYGLGTSTGAHISGSSSMTKGSDHGLTGIDNQTSSSSQATGQKSTEGEDNLANQEPKITDIGMKRNMNVTRRRKPVQFQNTNAPAEAEQPTNTQAKETKPPETTKPERTPPPTTPPLKKRKNEHEIVKASMSSRKPGNVKKSRKLTKVTSTKAAANVASTSTFTLQQPETVPPPVIEGQDDTIVLPPTQSAVVEVDPSTMPQPVTATTAPAKKEDPFGYMFGQTLLSSRQEGGSEREHPVDDRTLPLLPNLSRFWEQDMLFPILPFSFGNPNTATAGSFCFTDRDAAEYAPNVTPVPFVTEKNGMDLVRRFNAIMDEIQGINNRPNQFDEDVKKSNPEDFIASIPRRMRRPSM